MDAAAFKQVYEDFQEFHACFAPLFGRRETRMRSGHYLQALLVQSGERRNAENLSETVPESARGMQRFLTDSPWDDDAVIGRLQDCSKEASGEPPPQIQDRTHRNRRPGITGVVMWLILVMEISPGIASLRLESCPTIMRQAWVTGHFAQGKCSMPDGKSSSSSYIGDRRMRCEGET